MGVDPRVERIRTSVTEQTGLVLSSDAYKGWAQSESINADDLVIFNNSFLFREGRSTARVRVFPQPAFGVLARGEEVHDRTGVTQRPLDRKLRRL